MIDFKTLGEALNPNTGRIAVKDLARELEAINNPTPPAYKVPTKLLGKSNAKTEKNDRETHILYLIPTDKNSKKKNLCPFASKGCAKACLVSAGRGKFNNVKTARGNKTEYFVQDPKTFTAQLILEIETLIRKAKKDGRQIAVRLNGTADIDFLHLFKKYHGWNYEEKAVQPGTNEPGVIFYDYTPNPHKYKRYKGTKYALIFSKKEDNAEEVEDILSIGGKVSAVFKDGLPETHNGTKVVNGDLRDDLIIDIVTDPAPVIIGLKAKGDAKKDTTGFVITDHLNTGANV